MKKGYLSLLGFLMFLIGILGLVLSLVGLDLSMLSFASSINRTFGLVIKLLLIFFGMIILYVSKTGSRVD